jgi:transcriptional antiterminator RfaH
MPNTYAVTECVHQSRGESVTLDWFVATTKPRQEKVAAQQLENQNFCVYLPLFRRSKHRNGKWKKSSEVLFPGYVFIQLDLEKDDISPIRSTIGVQGLVRFGNQLAPLDQKVISYLQKNEQLHFGENVDHAAQFASGDAVKLLSGPFAGLNGVFDISKSSARVIVLLSILGGWQSVTIDLNNIAPI